MNVLTARYIRVRFGGRSILDGIDLDLDSGEMIAVSGKTGSGKTTLLSIISGLLRPDSGQVFFKGQNIFKWNDIKKSRYRNRKVGHIFQSFNLLPDMTVFQNICYPAMLNFRFRGLKGEVRRLMHLLEITDISGSYPSTLSGGEKQRVAIARAIINRPEIIIADEPTGNLDSETGRSIFRILNNIRTKNGIAVVFATHDSEIIKNSDVHYHLKAVVLEKR